MGYILAINKNFILDLSIAHNLQALEVLNPVTIIPPKYSLMMLEDLTLATQGDDTSWESLIQLLELSPHLQRLKIVAKVPAFLHGTPNQRSQDSGRQQVFLPKLKSLEVVTQGTHHVFVACLLDCLDVPGLRGLTLMLPVYDSTLLSSVQALTQRSCMTLKSLHLACLLAEVNTTNSPRREALITDILQACSTLEFLYLQNVQLPMTASQAQTLKVDPESQVPVCPRLQTLCMEYKSENMLNLGALREILVSRSKEIHLRSGGKKLTRVFLDVAQRTFDWNEMTQTLYEKGERHGISICRADVGTIWHEKDKIIYENAATELVHVPCISK